MSVRTNALQYIESVAPSAMDAASQSFQPRVLGRTAQRREARLCAVPRAHRIAWRRRVAPAL